MWTVPDRAGCHLAKKTAPRHQPSGTPQRTELRRDSGLLFFQPRKHGVLFSRLLQGCNPLVALLPGLGGKDAWHNLEAVHLGEIYGEGEGLRELALILDMDLATSDVLIVVVNQLLILLGAEVAEGTVLRDPHVSQEPALMLGVVLFGAHLPELVFEDRLEIYVLGRVDACAAVVHPELELPETLGKAIAHQHDGLRVEPVGLGYPCKFLQPLGPGLLGVCSKGQGLEVPFLLHHVHLEGEGLRVV
mmetsp:Transcript_57797/g.124988  ORF Transcript_57797/g.124988 Transcript_57797/m.124988 type:complete len:246 (+) Transcript_57797:211-948(+)